ncbi:MAG: hypothetical protein K2X48_05315 [Chitinophagaceae bacterium]|nr:hypothetical protein [Chitinophagaceae bacterium]
MKWKLLLLMQLFFFTQLSAQRLKLNPQVEADTVYVCLQFDTAADSQLKSLFNEHFKSAISRFQQSANKLVIVTDESGNNSFIHFKAGATEYSKKKESVRATALNGALLGAHVFMITRFGWTIPVFFFSGPSTFTHFRADFSKDLLMPGNKKSDFTFSSGAYFAGKERQQKRNAKELARVVYRLFKKIERKKR